MTFEDQIRAVCAQALAAEDDETVRASASQLRQLLHQHIERLRRRLVVAYGTPMMRHDPAGDAANPSASKVRILFANDPWTEARTWQQVAQEIAFEKDQDKVLKLSRELRYLLQGGVGSAGTG